MCVRARASVCGCAPVPCLFRSMHHLRPYRVPRGRGQLHAGGRLTSQSLAPCSLPHLAHLRRGQTQNHDAHTLQARLHRAHCVWAANSTTRRWAVRSTWRRGSSTHTTPAERRCCLSRAPPRAGRKSCPERRPRPCGSSQSQPPTPQAALGARTHCPAPRHSCRGETP